MQLSVLIPCYNESKIIETNFDILHKELNKTGLSFEVIFCNDGSTDDTLEVLRKIQSKDERVKLINHYPNRGTGYAYQRLYKSCCGDLIFQMDADFSMRPSDTIPIFLEEIKDADVVIGSRYKGINPRYPLRRWVPSKIYIMMSRLLFGINITDAMSGFIAFRKHVLKEINIESNGFEALLELIVKLKKSYNFKVKEVPIKFIHEVLSGETDVIFDGLRIFKNTLKLWFRFLKKRLKNEIWK